MPARSELEARARRRLLVAFVCVGGLTVLTIALNGGTGVGGGNHVGQLPVVRRALDRSYLPGDFTIELRRYHHRTFTYVVATGSVVLGEDRTLIALNVAGKGLLVTALWALCQAVGLPVTGFVAVAVVLATGLAATGRGLEINTLVGRPEVMPTTFAHAFVLLAVAALLGKRYRWAAWWAGLATTMHIQIGLIAAAMLAPFCAVGLRAFGGNELGRVLALFVVAAAPGLSQLAALVNRGLVPGASSGYSLAFYNDFRHPHHFRLRSTAAVWVTAHVVAQALVWSWLRWTRRPGAQAAGVLLALSLLLGALALVHVADYYAVRDGRVASLQLIRLTPLVTLFGAVSLMLAANVWAREHGRRTAVLVNAGAIFVASAWGAASVLAGAPFSLGVSRFAEERSDWAEICRWIRDHGPRAVYLTPPGNRGFTALAERSNVVEFKNNPDGGAQLAEWFARLRDLAGGALPHGRGFANEQRLNAAYARLRADQLVSLGRKYRAGYAVVPRGSAVELEVVHQNGGYRLVKLPVPPEAQGAAASR